jgi:hypothetical protein
MSNIQPDIADDKRNNCCPVTINYGYKYIIVLQMVNFSFCKQADEKYYKKGVNIKNNNIKKVDKYKINL